MCPNSASASRTRRGAMLPSPAKAPARMNSGTATSGNELTAFTILWATMVRGKLPSTTSAVTVASPMPRPSGIPITSATRKTAKTTTITSPTPGPKHSHATVEHHERVDADQQTGDGQHAIDVALRDLQRFRGAPHRLPYHHPSRNQQERAGRE